MEQQSETPLASQIPAHVHDINLMPESQHKPKMLFYGLGLLLVIFVIGGTYMFVSKSNTNNKQNALTSLQSPEIAKMTSSPKNSSNSTSISTQATANSKTYINRSFDYQITYPIFSTTDLTFDFDPLANGFTMSDGTNVDCIDTINPYSGKFLKQGELTKNYIMNNYNLQAGVKIANVEDYVTSSNVHGFLIKKYINLPKGYGTLTKYMQVPDPVYIFPSGNATYGKIYCPYILIGRGKNLNIIVKSYSLTSK